MRGVQPVLSFSFPQDQLAHATVNKFNGIVRYR